MSIQSKPKFHKVKFLKSAVAMKGYPKTTYPEVAVVGRSNVGKSSLLNHLFGRKGLVKTSATPGKTQLLNFFEVDEEMIFVDLPGYGFAQVPMHVRKKWGPMIQNYMECREGLKCVLFLFDIRRTPTDEDRDLIDWIQFAEKQIILVLTKTDKLSKNQCAKQTKKILEEFRLSSIPHLHYSSTHNVGRKELVREITTALNDANQPLGDS